MSRVSFLDPRRATSMGGGGGGPGPLLGSYVDAHMDDVSCVRFGNAVGGGGGRTVLASTSEDGLIVVHDPTMPTEERALISVLNVGSPVRRAGFFGPGGEGIYALTRSETMSAYHWDSGQKVRDVGGGAGLRRTLSDAVKFSSSMSMSMSIIWWDARGPPFLRRRCLLGNSDGDGYLFRVDADLITPLVHLKGGHTGCIRDFGWIDGGGGGRRLVTGGGRCQAVRMGPLRGHAGVVVGGRPAADVRVPRGAPPTISAAEGEEEIRLLLNTDVYRARV
ncbi:LOW QUALITY PROTEIN: hypothetical protein ACHAW5_011135 [Stephanodiscus triporus]|uniref:Uncharacterized protein n=1 Tax=Stephanodiscus triporus TaxID=2934178 RepID=A0ABD3NRR7_9STRA